MDKPEGKHYGIVGLGDRKCSAKHGCVEGYEPCTKYHLNLRITALEGELRNVNKGVERISEQQRLELIEHSTLLKEKDGEIERLKKKNKEWAGDWSTEQMDNEQLRASRDEHCERIVALKATIATMKEAAKDVPLGAIAYTLDESGHEGFAKDIRNLKQACETEEGEKEICPDCGGNKVSLGKYNQGMNAGYNFITCPTCKKGTEEVDTDG